jgi:hypothetical protein
VSSAPIGNEETLHQRIFMPVKPFANAPGPLKGCDSLRLDVSMRALIQVEDILSICHDIDFISNNNSTGIAVRTCFVNVLSQL